MAETRIIMLGYILLLGCISFSLCEITISWSENYIEKQQGESGLLSCTAVGLDSQFDLVVIERVSPHQPNEKVLISRNQRVVDRLWRTERYKVHSSNYDSESKTFYINLMLTGVQGEDEGIYYCRHKSSETNAKLQLVVRVPIAYMDMRQITSNGTEIILDDGETASITENLGEGIMCYAKRTGSLVPATLAVNIDGKDVTSLFTPFENAEAIDPSGVEERFHSYKKLFYRDNDTDRTLEHTFNGKTLTCIGNQNGFATERRSVNLEIKYSPRVECDTYQHYGEDGKSLEMTCDVFANPKPEMFWTKVGEDGASMTPVVETHNLVIKDSVSVRPERDQSSDSYKTSLVFKELSNDHFGNYHLITSNRIGETTVTIQLSGSAKQVDVPQQHQPGQSLSVRSSSTRVIQHSLNPILILVLVFLHLQQ